MAHVELQLPPDYRFVALARLVVVAAARDAGMDEVRREDLRIAVSEATTNAIAAGERAVTPAPVVLRFGTADGGFQVTVRGAGAFGDHAGGPGGNAWFGDDGLATTVIQGLADHVEFVRGEGASVDLRFALSLSDANGDAPAEGAYPPGITP